MEAIFHEQVSELVFYTAFAPSVGFRLMKENLKHFPVKTERFFICGKIIKCLCRTFSSIERNEAKAAALSILECLDFA